RPLALCPWHELRSLFCLACLSEMLLVVLRLNVFAFVIADALFRLCLSALCVSGDVASEDSLKSCYALIDCHIDLLGFYGLDLFTPAVSLALVVMWLLREKLSVCVLRMW